jgi:Concanavalin A-like lectin/glucanases superfamily
VRARNGLLLSMLARLLMIAGAGCTPGPIEIATVPASNLTNGLIAHWAFDEDSGDVANDGSGNGHTGLLAGPGSGYGWITGEFGSALQFSGADYVTAPGIPRATPSYTVSAWVLIESTELGAPIANLISTEALGGGWALYATLPVPGQQSYVFRYATNAAQGYEVASCTCVVPGVWTHLAAVLDGDAATLTLYANGVPTSVATTSAILPGSTVLYMARSALLTPTFPLTGALDDIAIYSRALVAEEVAALSKAAAPDPQ